MNKDVIDLIGGLAIESMLFEVSAAPKPGLVDPFCSGAHKDMDYFTFLSSTASLHACFDEMAMLGMKYRDQDISKLLKPLRQCGMIYEKKMFSYTNGVNTHKGMIFTLGILCGCAGWNYGKQPYAYENICRLAAALCDGICEHDYQGLSEKKTLTRGEQIYLSYGFKGARGEAESGYQTIYSVAMPVYKQLKQENISANHIFIQTLLYLIADTYDTNIIARHNRKVCDYARASAAKAISLGGIFTGDGRTYIKEMEQDFIQRNISPGGCADLLAATHFLYRIETAGIDKM